MVVIDGVYWGSRVYGSGFTGCLNFWSHSGSGSIKGREKRCREFRFGGLGFRFRVQGLGLRYRF